MDVDGDQNKKNRLRYGKQCIYSLLNKIATKENITVLGLLMDLDLHQINNAFYDSRESLSEAILEVHRIWRCRPRSPNTSIDELAALKEYFESMDKGGLFQRVLGKYQFGKKDHMQLDETCPEDWIVKIRDLEKVGLFLCQHLSVPEFHAVLATLIEQLEPNNCLSDKCLRWIRQEEEHPSTVKPFARFEIFVAYLDCTKDRPENIMDTIYTVLLKKSTGGSELMNKALKQHKLEKKYYLLEMPIPGLSTAADK